MNQPDWDQLLTGYLDNEITQQDRQRVEHQMAVDSDYRAQHDELAALQTEISKLDYTHSKTTQWSEHAPDTTTRSSRSLGWVVCILSYLLLISYGIYEFATSDDENMLVKIAGLGILLGTGILLFSVMRQRRIESKTDRYKDVQI